MRLPVLSVLPYILVASLSVVGASSRHDLTFAERVAAQRALDRAYYARQIGATRPFDEAVPVKLSERKVRTYLKQSAALERYWGQPLRLQGLEGEARRIAEQSRMPERLAELHAALGNDALMILECLVRPVLVDRLTRSLLANDRRIQAPAVRKARALHRGLASGRISVMEDHPRRAVLEVVLASEDAKGMSRAPRGSSRLAVDADGLARWRSLVPARPGEIGKVAEERDAFVIRALLDESMEHLRVATYTIPKKTWDEWWPTVERRLDEARVPTLADATVPVDLLSLQEAETSCEHHWDNRSLAGPWPDVPSGGQPVWTGTHLILWGGFGAMSEKYDPVTDTWMQIPTLGAPTIPTVYSRAVWSGSEMLVHGTIGSIPLNLFNAGGRYDPQSDSWRGMSFTGAPQARLGHPVVWTDDRMVVSGGATYVLFGMDLVFSSQLPGGAYDPATDTWGAGPYFNRANHTAVWTGTRLVLWGGNCFGTGFIDPCAGEDPRIGSVVDLAGGTAFPTTSLNAPTPPSFYSTVWTGSEMIIWGGTSSFPVGLAAGHRYDPAANTWMDMSETNAPAGRFDHSAVWTGDEMIVWGGTDGPPFTRLASGGRYDPVSDAWQAVSAMGTPPPMSGHAATWTGQVMIVWGGSPVARGRYDPAADQWIPSGDPFVPPPRSGHAAVWTGNEMIIWEGSGERYDPALDTWRPITFVGAPTARRPSAVWTGDRLVVWGGGGGGGETNTGGRYDPLGDTWEPTSTLDAPEARGGHTAVWTGDEMIVWGGSVCRSTGSGCLTVRLQSGGLYDPIADRWLPTTIAGAPEARDGHTAVWAGGRMIVLGGRSFSSLFDTGGVYDPLTDVWTPTSTVDAPSQRTGHTAVWTGQEMIVWGGGYAPFANSGGRYDPSTDSWTPTQLVAAPVARSGHGAVWSPSGMIIWGGQGSSGALDTGGIYSPALEQWLATPTVEAPSARTGHSYLWTGQEMIVWGGTNSAGVWVNTGGRLANNEADDDGDGLNECGGDCDDADPRVRPGLTDLPGDVVDEDCDGAAACDPEDAWPNPGALVHCVVDACADLVRTGMVSREVCNDLIRDSARRRLIPQ